MALNKEIIVKKLTGERLHMVFDPDARENKSRVLDNDAGINLYDADGALVFIPYSNIDEIRVVEASL
jgi:hypothetical protein